MPLSQLSINENDFIWFNDDIPKILDGMITETAMKFQDCEENRGYGF